MDEVLKAYLAGCLDSDGYFTIKRSTYQMRVRGDATQPMFSEKVGLKQVIKEVPELLHQAFGGCLRIEKPSAKKGKPLHAWSVTDRQAVRCVQTVLPFLRVKHRQAEFLLELRELKNLPQIRTGEIVSRKSRWGHMVNVHRRTVDPKVIVAKERLHQAVKDLNVNTSFQQPQLIGRGLSGEEMPKRKRHR
jgi:hypothetical protein